mmetsp:Transcript_92732/g.271487  ORF Transcript_92732/g.271487 Transcript_92732/m.271487 type:complete len:275 (-) Transcript_92732:961-1785(-)
MRSPRALGGNASRSGSGLFWPVVDATSGRGVWNGCSVGWLPSASEPPPGAACSRPLAPGTARAAAPPPESCAASSRRRRSRAPGSAPTPASLEPLSGVMVPEATTVLAPAGCSARTCSTTDAKCWYSTAARSEARRWARACRRASARSRRAASGRSSASALKGSRSRSPRLGVRGGCLPGVVAGWPADDFRGVCARPPAPPVEGTLSCATTESKKWEVRNCASSCEACCLVFLRSARSFSFSAFRFMRCLIFCLWLLWPASSALRSDMRKSSPS